MENSARFVPKRAALPYLRKGVIKNEKYYFSFSINIITKNFIKIKKAVYITAFY